MIAFSAAMGTLEHGIGGEDNRENPYSLHQGTAPLLDAPLWAVIGRSFIHPSIAAGAAPTLESTLSK